MKLTGFEVRYYRSIGSEPVVLAPLKRINILIGENNSGKSNVLRALKKIADGLHNQAESLPEADVQRQDASKPFQFRLWFESEPQDAIAQTPGAGAFYVACTWPAGERPRVVGPAPAHVADSVPPVYILAGGRQSPSGSVRLPGDPDRLERLQRFVRKLLRLPDAVLALADDEHVITSQNTGQSLPLAAFGSGLQQLVLLAEAAASTGDSICCIEEPEMHLHPRWQREFIDFIADETTNRYLLSTHSPALIDAVNTRKDVQVFQLRLQDGATVGGPILTDPMSLHALRHLGVMPSDILQANCLVWVEEPSDRVYLKRWLELVSPDLVEGRDYSFMFYGGRLLTHLYANVDKVPHELVDALKVAPNAVVVMDSDRAWAGAALSEAKRRIQTECESRGSLCWITDGRAVENYLPKRVVAAACEALAGRPVTLPLRTVDRFDKVLARAMEAAGKPLDYEADKIEYARDFARRLDEGDVSEPLRQRLEAVASKIRACSA